MIVQLCLEIYCQAKTADTVKLPLGIWVGCHKKSDEINLLGKTKYYFFLLSTDI